jgi:hypothetical protein
VLELSSITISQVPAGVTGVTVSFAPLYSAIQINGDYVTTDPVTATFTLTAASTAGVWEATPQQLVFPSKGVPTITVTFTHDNEDPSTYTYTADAALSANNKYDIAGTYTEPLGVTLSGGITFQPWATNPTSVNFDFDENNNVNNSGAGGDHLIAGQTYNDYYVISVNETRREAVLLSKNNRTADDDKACQNILSSMSKPQDAIGDWRIPTVSECQAFLSNEAIPGIFTNGSSDNYFCYNEGALNRCKAEKSSEGTITFTLKSADGFNTLSYIRPVIDISY